MGFISVLIQFYLKTCAKNKDGKGGWTKQKTRLENRSR